MVSTRLLAPARLGARVLALLLGACASTPSGTPPPAAPPAAVPVLASTPGTPVTSGTNGAAAATPPASAATPPRAADPPPPKPFADVIRDAKETKGFFGVWQKDEKVWLEIKPEQLDKPLFFGIAIASGLGDFTYLPGLMGREQVVELHKVGTTLQLVARNLSVRAPVGSPLETAVRESYSDSLLASAPIASAPHPERKSILVDATTLLAGDIRARRRRWRPRITSRTRLIAPTRRSNKHARATPARSSPCVRTMQCRSCPFHPRHRHHRAPWCRRRSRPYRTRAACS